MTWPVFFLLTVAALLGAAYTASICGMLGLAVYDAARGALLKMRRAW